MEAENLYDKITEILELGEKIKSRRETIQFGDSEVVRHNRLVDSLPTIFSYEDLIEYHIYLSSKRVEEEIIPRIEKFLVIVREVCTPSAYKSIESTLRENFRIEYRPTSAEER